MLKFKCVKPTTFKGRQVALGTKINAIGNVADSLKGKPAWEPEDIPEPVMETKVTKKTDKAKPKSII